MRPYILRRLKTDRQVIADLPDKTEVRAFCALTRRAGRPLPAGGRRSSSTRLGAVDGIERRGTVLAILMRLKQICNHPSQWLGDGGYAPDAERQVRAGWRELGEELAARQEKVLVFTQFREITDPLAELPRAESSAGRAWCCTAGPR